MLHKIINEKYYCGLDVGAQKIKVAVLKTKDAQNIEVLGVYEQKTHGFKKGSVSDLGEFSECISHALHSLLDKVGVKVKEVQLGLGGELVEAQTSSTVIPLVDKGTKIISSKDIKYVNEQARLLSIKIDEEVLHDLPQQYLVDDVNSALNPQGLYARKLGVTSLMVMCHLTRMRNIIKAVNQAGYDVGSTAFSPLMAADVSLTDQERLEGCAVIDIGSEVSSILVFKDRVLKGFDKIACGGDTFTKAIAKDLNLPFGLAEEIKISYGDALGQDLYHDEEVLVKQDSTYIPVRREVIFNAIKPHTEMLVHDVQQSLIRAGVGDKVNNGIVVLGGGGLLPGLIEKISQSTNSKVRLGSINFALQKQLRNAAVYSSAIGLAHHGFKQTFSYSLATNQKGSKFKFFTNKVKDFYQEYF
ncbi:MAG: cell division protein FtsA [Lysobacterales bacterium]|jgi:cell division protein FtsA